MLGACGQAMSLATIRWRVVVSCGMPRWPMASLLAGDLGFRDRGVVHRAVLGHDGRYPAPLFRVYEYDLTRFFPSRT